MTISKIQGRGPKAVSAARGLTSRTRVEVAEAADAATTLGGEAQRKAERTAVAGKNRLKEAAAKASHTAEQLAAKVAHSAKETAQQVVHGAKEAVGAAKHRQQERAGAIAKARK